ncbi:MAG TPA: hypothetical protein VK784_15805, partial [Pseudonocardiaceae bacterium]|nr:hypothetical protein [Pseudonocardiaceae bacterium]
MTDDAQGPCAAASQQMGRARGLEELNGEHDNARRRHRRGDRRIRDRCVRWDWPGILAAEQSA